MMRRDKARSDGLGLTKVGVWFGVFYVIFGLAAANTGNNGLYLVVAMMTAALVVSQVLAVANVRGLAIALSAHQGEIFANQPAHLWLEITSRARFLPSWLLTLTIDPRDISPPPLPPRRRSSPFLVPFLRRREAVEGSIEMVLRRRGRRRVRYAHVTSLFPLGVFRKGRRYPVDLEVLVYPELISPSPNPPEQHAKRGEEPTRRPGWGHELLGLRGYRHGDDPRWIHWKQSARTGSLVFQEHETEENRRLLIVLDNAVGELDEDGTQAFEGLVSVAATAAVDFLERGYEVSLTTREGTIPFASGSRQRLMVLETLALVEALARATPPLAAPHGEGHLHLDMDGVKMEGPAFDLTAPSRTEPSPRERPA